MPFFLDGNPTQGEISEAINYLLGNTQLTTSTNVVNGQVTDALGDVVSYLYKYIYVKYADSFDGTVNFSNTPTNRQYYGLRNDDSGTESTNPADYVWYQVSGGFSTTKFIFYSVTGGRRVNILVSTSAPSILYQADSGAAIDLDQISGSDGASFRICYAKSTSFALASTPTTYQTSGPSSFPPYNTWGGAETWQATPPTLSVNEALFQSDGVYNPVSNLTTWNVPYLSNLRVGALSAISANLGSITAGSLNAVTITGSELTIGSSPAISGTTMTGSGTKVYTDGRFALGNSTGNIIFNGTKAYVNGFAISAAGSFVGGAEIIVPANSNSFTQTSTEAELSNLDSTKPIFVNTSCNIGVQSTTFNNATAPQSAFATCLVQYSTSTNNGASWSSWSTLAYIYMKDVSDNSTSILATNRNFTFTGADVSIVNVASNVTNVKFRTQSSFTARLNRDFTSDATWAQITSPLPYAVVGMYFTDISTIAYQIKV